MVSGTPVTSPTGEKYLHPNSQVSQNRVFGGILDVLLFFPNGMVYKENSRTSKIPPKTLFWHTGGFGWRYFSPVGDGTGVPLTTKE